MLLAAQCSLISLDEYVEYHWLLFALSVCVATELGDVTVCGTQLLYLRLIISNSPVNNSVGETNVPTERRTDVHSRLLAVSGPGAGWFTAWRGRL